MGRKWGRLPAMISMRLSAEQRAWVVQQAEARGITPSDVIRDLVDAARAGPSFDDVRAIGRDPAHSHPSEWSMPADALQHLRSHMDVSLVLPNGAVLGSDSRGVGS